MGTPESYGHRLQGTHFILAKILSSQGKWVNFLPHVDHIQNPLFARGIDELYPPILTIFKIYSHVWFKCIKKRGKNDKIIFPCLDVTKKIPEKIWEKTKQLSSQLSLDKDEESLRKIHFSTINLPQSQQNKRNILQNFQKPNIT